MNLNDRVGFFMVSVQKNLSLLKRFCFEAALETSRIPINLYSKERAFSRHPHTSSYLLLKSPRRIPEANVQGCQLLAPSSFFKTFL